MIKRRVLAAILLYGFAVGSVWFWRGWPLDLFQTSINLGFATLGLLILHRRWKKQEARIITPSKAKDIFS